MDSGKDKGLPHQCQQYRERIIITVANLYLNYFSSWNNNQLYNIGDLLNLQHLYTDCPLVMDVHKFA